MGKFMVMCRKFASVFSFLWEIGKIQRLGGTIMASTYDNLSHSFERKTAGMMIDVLLRRLANKNDAGKRLSYLHVVDFVSKFWKEDKYKERFDAARRQINDPNGRWPNFITRIINESDPHVLKTFVLNVGYEMLLRGSKEVHANREKYNCNIPMLIIFDPTSACNMHCEGCWSGTYGHKDNLTFEEMDRIMTQGKELGVHLFLMTGGEPLVRKKDILKLAEKHQDCEIGFFTNSTLIDEKFCEDMVRVGNLAPLLSVEGSEETNDARRGKGHYQAVMNAMDLLKKHGIIFGTSVCYTKYNLDAVTNDDFFNFLSEKGARLGFFFHYMPVGNNAVVDLMPTPEQRVEIIKRIRKIRSPESKIEFFPMDFQDDGEYVNGCIAAGRQFFHITSAGDAEPCVFIHYSDSNIKDKSILEILQSPLFQTYRSGQPFNRNHFRPCPMLENPYYLREIVNSTGAKSTNQESEESVEHLTDKCVDYAAEWAPVAEKTWKEMKHYKPAYANYDKAHTENEELAGFVNEPQTVHAEQK